LKFEFFSASSARTLRPLRLKAFEVGDSAEIIVSRALAELFVTLLD